MIPYYQIPMPFFEIYCFDITKCPFHVLERHLFQYEKTCHAFVIDIGPIIQNLENHRRILGIVGARPKNQKAIFNRFQQMRMIRDFLGLFGVPWCLQR